MTLRARVVSTPPAVNMQNAAGRCEPAERAGDRSSAFARRLIPLYSEGMLRVLDAIDYRILVPVAILLALAPFRPEPHLVEKLRMLFNGTLSKPIDIFDLFLHATPLLLLLVKAVADLVRR